MTSHYPTTSELAAFRYRVAHDNTGQWPTDPDASGAWSDERQHGIGYSWSRDGSRLDTFDAAGTSLARREASAMRSRAYAALYQHPDAGRHSGFAERMFGIPAVWQSVTAEPFYRETAKSS